MSGHGKAHSIGADVHVASTAGAAAAGGTVVCGGGLETLPQIFAPQGPSLSCWGPRVRIEQQFEVGRSRQAVWQAMGDLYLVAECLPGARIVEDLGGNRYKGQFSIKLGPLAASFDGDVSIERNPDDWTAVVSGKGSDARSSSRASGSMTYRLSATGPDATHVDVTSEINLAGALAQFGKAAVIEAIASRITAEFVRNFEARLARPATGAGSIVSAESAPTPPNPTLQASENSSDRLNVGALLWSILRNRIGSLFRLLAGPRENP